MNYINPYIIFKEEDILNDSNIINKFNSLLANDLTTCKRCGYNKEGNILNISNPTFYRLINGKKFPKIIYVLFDLLNYNDNGSRNEQKKNFFPEFQNSRIIPEFQNCSRIIPEFQNSRI